MKLVNDPVIIKYIKNTNNGIVIPIIINKTFFKYFLKSSLFFINATWYISVIKITNTPKVCFVQNDIPANNPKAILNVLLVSSFLSKFFKAKNSINTLNNKTTKL